ncbi:hypothetical protein GQ53DRAFT_854961 [Thozetella sp. PMI_491]|nr:hypothetical protein GQ53DRAFT_854961 [Thozetella sp. PMI_491]
MVTKPSVEDDWSQCLKTLAGHRTFVRAVALSMDGRLASASSDGAARIWDPRYAVKQRGAHD